MPMILVACLSFLAGVAGFYSERSILLFIAAIIVVLASLFTNRKRPTFRITMIAFACIAGSFFAAQLFCRFYESRHTPELSDDYFNYKTEIVATVTEDPDRGIDGTKVVARPLSIGGERIPDDLPDRILIRLGAGVAISYGDTIQIDAMLEKPEPFMSDTNREFDYPRYLMLNDITGITRAYDAEITPSDDGSSIKKKLYAVKQFVVGKMKTLYPSPESGFLAGIVIGVKSLLPDEVNNDFQIAGLTHMVVLSGYNITIVTTVFVGLFAYLGLGYRNRRIAAVAAIALFIIMTGLNASAVRAGIMATIAVILQVTSRPAHTLRIIVFTLVVMIMTNPRTLLWDPSLHLSFLAFAGLAYVAPITVVWVEKWPRFFGLTDILGETLGVQLFVLPYILWMSGRISVLSLLANVITVPIVPILMAAGFASIMAGIVWMPVAAILAVPVKWGLAYIIAVAHTIASVNIATFTIPPFGAGVLVACYATVCGYLTFRMARSENHLAKS